jgi:glycosyltransferase involved in cell wall biosynthesis
MHKTPKVSVLMITYNHENFIEAAMTGVINQSGIDFEFIISDDCSTDNTSNLIQKFLENKGNQIKIHFFNQSQNLGMIQNFLFAISKCKGEYIAFCEGDDYWTENLKLKKQVDFLDSNPSFSASLHQVKIWDERHQVYLSNYFQDWENSKPVPAKFVIEKGGGSFPSCSLVFRNLNPIPSTLFLNSPSADRPLSLLLLLKGEFFYHNDNMGVYRMHQNGVMTGMLNDPKKLLILYRKNLLLLDLYLKICKWDQREFVLNSISKQVKNILLIEEKQKYVTGF